MFLLLFFRTSFALQSPYLRISRFMATDMVAPKSSSDVSIKLPSLIVFDLDMCLWSPEMYTLDELPQEKIYGSLGKFGEGVVGVKSGYEVIRLFPAALTILQEFYTTDTYGNMRIAIASSADTPRAVAIGRQALNMLEIIPGVSVRAAFSKGWDPNFEGNVQIGRSPPLSSDKSMTHFPILLRETGIPYNEMVFFDDCIWHDHCGTVARNCPGVVTQRTPRGIQLNEWKSALQSFANKI